MGIARSTFYDRPAVPVDDAAIIAEMRAVGDVFETYGYRRMAAALRHLGFVVNTKKVEGVSNSV